MNLNQNHFELFGLPARFGVDAATLEARYRELQREVHPDRFAAAPQPERRVSMQLATRVNEAYQTLKSPLRRAVYILRLRGALSEESAKIYERLRRQLDEGRDDEAASGATRMLMFYEKLADEIDDRLAELET